ncbi:MAG: SRPBCC family protein [Candidatus Kapaibacterium sp.]
MPKQLKIALLAFGAFVVVILVVASFLPSEFSVEREITINEKADSVFIECADLTRFRQWEPWSEMDSTIVDEFSGPVAKEGMKWSWKGDIMGPGSLTLTTVKQNEIIQSELIFGEEGDFKNQNIWIFEPQGDKTKLRWILRGELSYPFNRFVGLFLEEQVEQDFDKGLKKLKSRCES